jgi:hypothetical protein
VRGILCGGSCAGDLVRGILCGGSCAGDLVRGILCGGSCAGDLLRGIFCGASCAGDLPVRESGLDSIALCRRGLDNDLKLTQQAR